MVTKPNFYVKARFVSDVLRNNPQWYNIDFKNFYLQMQLEHCGNGQKHGKTLEWLQQSLWNKPEPETPFSHNLIYAIEYFWMLLVPACRKPHTKHWKCLSNILNLWLNQQVTPNGLHSFRNEISAKFKKSIYFAFYQSINDTLWYDVKKELSFLQNTEFVEQYVNKSLLNIFLLFENYFLVVTLLATAN